MHFTHFEHCSRVRNPEFAHSRPPPRPPRSLQGISKLHPRQGWRAPTGMSIGLQNCANAMVSGGPVRSKLAPKLAHPLMNFPRARGLIRGAPHCFPLSWKLKPVHFLVGEVKDLESCKKYHIWVLKKCMRAPQRVDNTMPSLTQITL